MIVIFRNNTKIERQYMYTNLLKLNEKCICASYKSSCAKKIANGTKIRHKTKLDKILLDIMIGTVTKHKLCNSNCLFFAHV